MQILLRGGTADGVVHDVAEPLPGEIVVDLDAVAPGASGTARYRLESGYVSPPQYALVVEAGAEP
jgi:hypothetical protein